MHEELIRRLNETKTMSIVGEEIGVEIRLQSEEIFAAMHRI